MRSQFLFQRFAVVCFALALAAAAAAQRPGSTPRQEKLLNGLKVLMWNDPAAEKVTLKLRIHSGSAFDPQDKEGVMKLLAENIFPTSGMRDFFKDDLGGSLEVISNYDYIQINASSKPSELLTMLDTIGQAVINPTIDKETTAGLKITLLDLINEKQTDPAYIADRAAAKRLFGNFPYGRPQLGTAESLKKIDFADLRFAKDRFLTSDNATLAITGNLNVNLAFRAIRRYFGAWVKSDKKIPATFRQPDEPDTKVLEIEVAGVTNPEVRHARRGFARNDKDYYASENLGKILDARIKCVMPEEIGENYTVINEAYFLPGAVIFKYRVRPDSIPALGFDTPGQISEKEFALAKTSVQAALDKSSHDDKWLDIDTYKLISFAEDINAFRNTTLADVQRISDRIWKNPEVTIVVKRAN